VQALALCAAPKAQQVSRPMQSAWCACRPASGPVPWPKWRASVVRQLAACYLPLAEWAWLILASFWAPFRDLRPGRPLAAANTARWLRCGRRWARNEPFSSAARGFPAAFGPARPRSEPLKRARNGHFFSPNGPALRRLADQRPIAGHWALLRPETGPVGREEAQKFNQLVTVWPRDGRPTGAVGAQTPKLNSRRQVCASEKRQNAATPRPRRQSGGPVCARPLPGPSGEAVLWAGRTSARLVVARLSPALWAAN